MARLARVKIEKAGAFYHLCARTAGIRGDYPLDNKNCRGKIVDLIRLFAGIYCCRVLGFCIMGDHYHLVVRMEPPRSVRRKELRKRAAILYKDSVLDKWDAENWKRFENRIFEVSELMRNLQSKIAGWFNAEYKRCGRFWADRFQSVLLEDEKTALDCLLYVELNPVRAGIVARPEIFDGSSAYYREHKDDAWMAPLTEITERSRPATAARDYKARLYYRGGLSSKDVQAAMSRRLLTEEKARGFSEPGAFDKRIPHFSHGVVVGSADFVQKKLDELRADGQYLRRRKPIPQLDGAHTCLRPHRKSREH